jgi:hypothetical protein
MKELNSDFTNAKVGDPAYHLDGRVGEIREINNENRFPIRVRLDGTLFHYTLDGKCAVIDNHPSIFTHPVAIIHADDLENIGGFKERVMWVSSDGKTWYRRVVFHKKNGRFFTWDFAESIEGAEKVYHSSDWKYAREINHRAIEIKEQIEALQKELETIENSK